MSWRAKRVNFMLTPDIVADQLAALDAAVQAAPDDAAPLEERARFRAETTWDELPVVSDCIAALTLRIDGGELPNADFAALAQEWKRQAGSKREFGPTRFARAMGIAHFGRALKIERFDAELWIGRARLWAAMGERQRAESDFDAARHITGESANSWLDQAHCFERMLQWDAAYHAYLRAIFVGKEQGIWTLDAANCLARANREETPAYRRRAWLDAAVETAPDDVDLRLARAKLLKQENFAGAEQDYERAIALRPTDPAVYEARADSDVLWHHSLVIRDYQTAVRLRVQTGEIAREVSALTTRAKAVKEQGKSASLASYLRAIACYGIAIEIAPQSHTLYLARARLRAKVRPHRFENPDLLDSADEDWIRALSLKPNLPDARRLLAQDLAESARRTTAHEQLETWLELRDLLRERGLNDDLIERLLAEVQAQWARDEAP